jgi:hypothetical protein
MIVLNTEYLFSDGPVKKFIPAILYDLGITAISKVKILPNRLITSVFVEPILIVPNFPVLINSFS